MDTNLNDREWFVQRAIGLSAALIFCVALTGCAMQTASIAAPQAESKTANSGGGHGGTGSAAAQSRTTTPAAAAPPVTPKATHTAETPADVKPTEKTTDKTDAIAAPKRVVLSSTVEAPQAPVDVAPQAKGSTESAVSAYRGQAEPARSVATDLAVDKHAAREIPPQVGMAELPARPTAKKRESVAPAIEASQSPRENPGAKADPINVVVPAAKSPSTLSSPAAPGFVPAQSSDAKRNDRAAPVSFGGSLAGERAAPTASPSIDLFSKIAGPVNASVATTQPSTLSRAQALGFLAGTSTAHVAVWSAARPLGIALNREEAKRQIEQGADDGFVVAPLTSTEPAQMQEEIDKASANRVPAQWLKGDAAEAARKERLARRAAAQDANRAGREKVEASVYDFLLGDQAKPAAK